MHVVSRRSFQTDLLGDSCDVWGHTRKHHKMPLKRSSPSSILIWWHLGGGEKDQRWMLWCFTLAVWTIKLYPFLATSWHLVQGVNSELKFLLLAKIWYRKGSVAGCGLDEGLIQCTCSPCLLITAFKRMLSNLNSSQIQKCWLIVLKTALHVSSKDNGKILTLKRQQTVRSVGINCLVVLDFAV